MASIPFNYECDKSSGFIMDPNEHKTIGYVTTFKAANVTLAQDLHVSLQYNGGTGGTSTPPSYSDLKATPVSVHAGGGSGSLPMKASVVGVIEKFEWAGGVGSEINLEFWVSQENATQYKTIQQSVMQTTNVNMLGFWICTYDQETKQWYETAYPLGGDSPGPYLSGIVGPRDSPKLDIDLNPSPAKDGIDVYVYKVTIGVSPAANQAYQMTFANSPTKRVAKAWGLKVGNLAATANAGT